MNFENQRLINMYIEAINFENHKLKKNIYIDQMNLQN
jgi:hypothetical protein